MVGYFDLVYGLLFLVPGYLTYWAVVQQQNLPRAHDASEKTVWSLLGSGVALSAVGLFVSVPLVEEPVPWQTLATTFLLTATVALAIGLTVGFLLNRFGIRLDGFLSERFGYSFPLRHNAWEHIDFWGAAKSKRGERGVLLSVKTTRGEEFLGRTNYLGTIADNDLLLSDPHWIDRDDDWGEHTRIELAGDHLYVPENEIAHLQIRERMYTRPGTTPSPSSDQG